MNMTICECIEFIENMTDDKAILETLDYIDQQVKKMSCKLSEYKENVDLLTIENEELKRVNKAKYEMYLEQIKTRETYEKAFEIACHYLSNTYIKTTCGEHNKNCMENHCIGDRCVHSTRLTNEEWGADLLEEARKEIEDEVQEETSSN